MTSKTMNVNGMTVVVTDSRRSRDFHGRTLRSVFFTLPNVAPLGVEWNAKHTGRKFELTSFNDGAVEVYVMTPDGLPRYMGTVRDYFPSEQGQAWLRAAWLSEQPSKAARAAFELSAGSRRSELSSVAA